MGAIINLSKINVQFLGINLRILNIHRKFTQFNLKRNIHPTYFYYNSRWCTTNKEQPQENSKSSGGILALTLKGVSNSTPKGQPARGCFHPGASVLSRESLPLKDQDVVSGRQMIQSMLQYIWPKDDKMIRDRVKLAVGLLIAAKAANVCVPFTFKYAVDYLNASSALNMDSAPETATTIAISLLVGCEYLRYRKKKEKFIRSLDQLQGIGNLNSYLMYEFSVLDIIKKVSLKFELYIQNKKVE